MTAEEDQALLQACATSQDNDTEASLAAEVKGLLLDILVKAEQRPSSQELTVRVDSLCDLLSSHK
jgi:hypothetical protein